MPDLVLDYHRYKTPIDHPDGSVVTAKIADGAVATVPYSDPVPDPIIRFHAKILTYNMKYKVTVTQTSGTLRSFSYSFVLEVLGLL
jgi:hypothetical protein